jgi:hypothetical protein
VRCYGRYFFFSNKGNALSLDNQNGERRMIIFRAKSTCKAEEGGFDESDWVYLKLTYFKSAEFRLALFRAISTVDISEYRPKRWRDLTMSAAYFEAMQAHASFLAKFFTCYVKELAAEVTELPVKIFTAATQKWEPLNANRIDIVMEVEQSELHRRIHDFASRLSGGNARELAGQRDNIISFHEGLITEKKSNVLKYCFNPRTVWKHLIENRWVAHEGYVYHQAKYEAEIADTLEHEVDPTFKKLACADVRYIAARSPL